MADSRQPHRGRAGWVRNLDRFEGIHSPECPGRQRKCCRSGALPALHHPSGGIGVRGRILRNCGYPLVLREAPLILP